MKDIINRLKRRIESGLENGLITMGTTCDLHTIIKELEKKLSESDGSVSCKAHRPIDELKKEYEKKFICRCGGKPKHLKLPHVEDLWKWIETEILKVR
ncbi:MAG: hypothetical protein HYS25_13725 [Ignavibacteriales bacterium]|nr:hypothetical protein [Ignavibacteriales bacterium]